MFTVTVRSIKWGKEAKRVGGLATIQAAMLCADELRRGWDLEHFEVCIEEN